LNAVQTASRCVHKSHLQTRKPAFVPVEKPDLRTAVTAGANIDKPNQRSAKIVGDNIRKHAVHNNTLIIPHLRLLCETRVADADKQGRNNGGLYPKPPILHGHIYAYISLFYGGNCFPVFYLFFTFIYNHFIFD
jgi:hypothetical protein